MPCQITLTISQGKLKGQQFIFDERTTCIMGRSLECHPQLPNDDDHRTISRFHCLLDINPPDICIRDFGSKNGTYVNGKIIGKRESHQTPEEGAKFIFPEYDLHSGDEIQLGNTIFTVDIQGNSETTTIEPPSGLDCTEIVNNLLSLAESGDNNLLAIKGYKLLKVLGKGGCGEVHLARHSSSGKYVALKVMLPKVATNEWAVELFLREMANTKALQHPNVVDLLDYGHHEGVFFFTMEYCEGGTVQDLMKQHGGRLPVNLAVPIILQLLDGLEYTHNAEIPYVKLADGTIGQGRGLVHRDLKPSNIFLTKINGQMLVKIGDYGLSKAFDLAGLSGQTMTGRQVGTPIFMCRQQLLNFKYAKPEVDVWAAAACLYNMLTRYFPRDFHYSQDQFLAVLENDPVPIQQRDASIPKELAKVIDLALQEKPEIYFKTATDLKNALLKVFQSS
jgi:pSer/pThr/pTyr-binding forkhead associated (FHA) protein